MNSIAESTIHEYAKQFWRRERDKCNPEGILAFEAIARGEDPVELLMKNHPYKLPHSNNTCLRIVVFTSPDEVKNLLVHDYLPNDDWMRKRGLTPQPFTRRLGTLASICLQRSYFESQWNDRQIRYYQDWKVRGSLTNVIEPEERPLIEIAETGEHEIVDGWGRLLSFAALLLEGLPVESLQAFCASPTFDPT